MEIVFVDDGSDDGTAQVVERYGERFSDLRVIRNETARGVAGARNQGMAASRGRYVVLLDADDWFAPGNLQSLLGQIETIGCDFVRTDFVQAAGTRRVLRRAPQAVRGVALDPRDSILPIDRITMVDHAWVPAGMYHRRLVDEGLMHFPEQLRTAEDRPWVWNLHLNARSYAVVDAPGFVYRVGVPDSLTASLGAKRLDYIPAIDVIREMVRADAECERFMPKVIQWSFALTEHHMKSSAQMEPEVRKRMRELVQALIARFPADQVREVIAGLSGERRAALGWMIEGTGIREATR
jgi:hypothetical protein